jgi:hypothetical protein
MIAVPEEVAVAQDAYMSGELNCSDGCIFVAVLELYEVLRSYGDGQGRMAGLRESFEERTMLRNGNGDGSGIQKSYGDGYGSGRCYRSLGDGTGYGERWDDSNVLGFNDHVEFFNGCGSGLNGIGEGNGWPRDVSQRWQLLSEGEDRDVFNSLFGTLSPLRS